MHDVSEMLMRMLSGELVMLPDQAKPGCEQTNKSDDVVCTFTLRQPPFPWFHAASVIPILC